MARTKASPRQRLLDAAGRLFYAEGIHTVPVDRLVTEAGVTRATFYRHFPAKEDLVVAYLKAADAELRAALEATARRVPASAGLTVLLDHTAASIGAAGFRGCHFVNAAAEYPGPDDRVRAVIAEHRAWLRETVTGLAARAGHPDPEYAGQVLVLLHDGARAGAGLDDHEDVRRTVLRAGRELLSGPGRAVSWRS
jgi:AcrR family transcriptional regulator